MNLYLIQDDDRPMYVVATDWERAMQKWTDHVCIENDCRADEMEGPKGIQLIAEDSEIIL